MTKEKWDALIKSGGEQIELLAMRVFDEDELLQERIAELTFNMWEELMKKPPVHLILWRLMYSTSFVK